MKTKPYRIALAAIIPLLAPIAMGETENQDREKKSTEATLDALEDSWRASEIIGSDVKNAKDEDLGEVKDVIVDLKSGEVLAVVISAGGFLGIGDTMSLVPGSTLRYHSEDKYFTTSLTKEQLGKAPTHKTENWKEEQKTMREKLRNFRNSIGGDVTKADNTAQNEDDADGDRLDPVDQGNSESDINMTKNIRVALMDTEMSFNAKNVKIITRDGRVTLRGVVDTAAEQKAIVDLAKKHAGEAKLDSEITVKND